MRVEPVVLQGPTLRLEPARPEHAPALWRALGRDVFRHTLEWPRDESLPAFEEWLAASIAKPDSLLFAIVPLEIVPLGAALRETVAPDSREARSGPSESPEPVGVTGYLEIRPAHRGLEIGRTLIYPAHQGTRVNPESKYLLLGHAFEALEAVRVQFKTDVQNLHSQRAIEKLGAKREGVLRRYQARSSGFVRDSAVYSITDDDWPAVKAGLERRLGLADVREADG
jgi:ribosomal-protein-alanine N-acetyltransferase